MSRTISSAGAFGSVDGTDRVPGSKGPFTPGAAGYHTVDSLKQFTLKGGAVPFYEVGEFTPGLTFQTPGTLNVTYTNRYGEYTRVGDLIFFSMRIAGSLVKGTAAGDGRFTGLPYPSVADSRFRFESLLRFDSANPTWPASAVGALAVIFNIGSPEFAPVWSRVSNSSVALLPADFTDSAAFDIRCTGQYVAVPL